MVGVWGHRAYLHRKEFAEGEGAGEAVGEDEGVGEGEGEVEGAGEGSYSACRFSMHIALFLVLLRWEHTRTRRHLLLRGLVKGLLKGLLKALLISQVLQPNHGVLEWQLWEHVGEERERCSSVFLCQACMEAPPHMQRDQSICAKPDSSKPNWGIFLTET